MNSAFSTNCFLLLLLTLNGYPDEKVKNRFTFLARVNGDGRGKFPLMIIGKFKKSKDFNGSTKKELGFDYYSNEKGWVNTELFL